MKRFTTLFYKKKWENPNCVRCMCGSFGEFFKYMRSVYHPFVLVSDVTLSNVSSDVRDANIWDHEQHDT